jgi:hypothetical protein
MRRLYKDCLIEVGKSKQILMSDSTDNLQESLLNHRFQTFVVKLRDKLARRNGPKVTVMEPVETIPNAIAGNPNMPTILSFWHSHIVGDEAPLWCSVLNSICHHATTCECESIIICSGRTDEILDQMKVKAGQFEVTEEYLNGVICYVCDKCNLVIWTDG